MKVIKIWSLHLAISSLLLEMNGAFGSDKNVYLGLSVVIWLAGRLIPVFLYGFVVNGCGPILF